MHKDFFTYPVNYKIFIFGNHKPRLSSVGEAIARRLHLDPFLVTIAKADRDKKLLDKLKKEGPGILRLLLDGYAAWRQDRIKPAPASC